jgi:hypothetical protein
LVMVALSLAPPGNAQVLMNLAPQALPNSPVGPTYSGTLDAVKSVSTPQQLERASPNARRQKRRMPLADRPLNPLPLCLLPRSVN